VPLDPAYPGERLSHILSDAGPQVVLADQTGQATLGEALLSRIVLDPNTLPNQPDNNPTVPALTSRHLAYVIYTSGSTGTPKGVMVEHRGLVNYTNHALHQFDVTTGTGSLILTSFSFDLTITSFYPTLICGKTIHLCSEGNDAFSWRQHILSTQNLSLVKLTPSHLDLLQQALQNNSVNGRIRTLVVGGELLKGIALLWWRQYAPTILIFNHYGPT
jgi:non-ribosomal peptide synthetase component F